MKKINYVIIIIILIIVGFNCIVLADSSFIEKPKTKKVKPGNLSTIVFSFIYNGNEEEITVETRLKGPKEWTVFTPSKKIKIKKGKKTPIFVTVSVPSGTETGVYEIELIIKNKDKMIKQIGKISVLPVRGFKINLLNKSPELHPGKSKKLVYQIINKGNVEITIELNPSLPENWSFADAKKKIKIKSGKSKKLILTVTAPLKTEPGTYSLLLNFKMNNLFKSVSNIITVLPSYPEEVGGSIWWKIPGEFNINSYYGSNTSFEMLGNVLLSGKLPKEHWITLVWDQELNSDIKMPTLTVGKKDMWYVRAGRVIQGSSFAELDGMGGQINRRLSSKLSLKGTLASGDEGTDGAIEGKWDIKPDCTLTIGIVKLDNLIGYCRLNYFPTLNWNIKGEIANDFHKNGLAWEIKNEFLRGKWDYNLDYKCYYEGFIDYNKRQLNLSAQRDGEKTDIQFDIDQKYTDKNNNKIILEEQEAAAELEWKFDNELNITCKGEYSDSKQEADNILVNKEAGLTVSYPLTDFLICDIGINREKKHLDNSKYKGFKDYWNVGVNGHMGSINWQSCYKESLTEGSDKIYEELGLSKEWKVRMSTSISKAYLWWERIKKEEEWKKPVSDIANIYGVMLPFTLIKNKLYSTIGYDYEHHINKANIHNYFGSLNLRYSNSANMYLCMNNILEGNKDPEWNLSLGINRQFNLPLYGIKKMGRIEGYVFIDVNDNGRKDINEKGIGDVVIISESGEQALSNEKGYFQFTPMEPGIYNLFVRNLSKNYTLDWEGNIKVKLPKDVVKVSIPAHRQSVMNIRFFIDENSDGKYQSNEEGLKGVSFLINSNDLNKVYQSGNNGNISLGIPEGSYKIAINEATLPKWYRLKDSSQRTVTTFCDKITYVEVPIIKVNRKLDITVVAPYTDFYYKPSSIKSGESITFNASDSTSMNGKIKMFRWKFGKKIKETKNPVVKYKFNKKGKHLVKLIVIDSEGSKGYKTKIIEVK